MGEWGGGERGGTFHKWLWACETTQGFMHVVGQEDHVLQFIAPMGRKTARL